MPEWKYYFKAAKQEMRPYIVGEDLKGVSVSEQDTPEKGGMIARNSDNHDDKWYVAKDFYESNYKEKTKTVVLCGSSKFCQIMAVCAWYIEKYENAISMGLHLLPSWYPEIDSIPDHLAEFEGVAEQMDNLHLRKIDLCDEIFVVNYNDYIGESTKREIAYAQKNGKNVRWFTNDEIGEMVNKLIK